MVTLYTAAGLTSSDELLYGRRTEEVRRTDDPDSVPEGHRALYEPGALVWVGRSRGSEREGSILRYLGEGFYSVAIVGPEGVKTIHEGLLHPRREDDEEGRAEPESMPSL